MPSLLPLLTLPSPSKSASRIITSISSPDRSWQEWFIGNEAISPAPASYVYFLCVSLFHTTVPVFNSRLPTSVLSSYICPSFVSLLQTYVLASSVCHCFLRKSLLSPYVTASFVCLCFLRMSLLHPCVTASSVCLCFLRMSLLPTYVPAS